MKRIRLCLLMLCLGCLAANAQNNPEMKYQEEWKEIDKLATQGGLPKSALEKVLLLYHKAINEKAYAQVLKAISYRVRFVSQIDENAPTTVLAELKADAEKLPQPAKSVVYVYLGDFFYSYYRNNSWSIADRTGVSANPEDFQTWSLQQLADEAVRYYELAMHDAAALQETPTADYADILSSKGSKPTLLPTLYDLIGYRVLQSMADARFDDTRPQEAFVINSTDYFSPAGSFVNLALPATDTASVKYKSLRLYQRLLKFRLSCPASPTNEAALALIDLDMRRLEYVRNNGTYGNTDELYEKALHTLLGQDPTSAGYARIAYQLAYLYKDQGMGWRSSRKPEHRGRLVEAHKLCNEIMKRTNRNTLYSHTRLLRNEISAPSLTIDIETNQTPNSPILYKATYRNVDTIHLFIYPLKEDQNIPINRYDYKDALKNRKAIAVAMAKTVSQHDYQQYSTELMLQGLEQGRYLIVATNRADFLTAENDERLAILPVNINVYGLTFLTRSNSNTSMLVYVTDRITGKPVEGAKVQTYYTRYSNSGDSEKLNATYTTAKDGTVSVSTTSNNDRYYIRTLKISHGEKYVYGSPNSYGYGYENKRTDKVVFFTDRAIYRPGQTVYFKALMINTDNDGDNKLVAGRNLSVELRDVNNRVVATQTITTNRFGSIQGSFAIPQGLLNGQMSLRTSYGSTYFSVEEYKRPTFGVSFSPVTETYMLNDEVKVVGTAKALAGYAVDNAKVQYRVQRQTAYRYYRWWWPSIAGDVREIASGVAATDDKGEFTISFTALADDVKNNDLIYTYTVTADVTDVNGETRSSNLNLRISNKPLLLNAQLPDVITAAERMVFPISTTNLNGEDSPAEVSVSVTQLRSPDRILRKRPWAAPDTLTMSRQEFVESFPLDIYGDEDLPTSFTALAQVVSLSINTQDSKELNLSALKNAASGWYRIDLKARNDKGVEVEQQMYVQLENAEPEPIRTMDSWVKLVKSSAEPGENAVFTVAGGEDKTYILYELKLKDKTIQRQLLEVGKTPKRIEIPIKEEHRGGIGLRLILVQNNRLYINQTTIQVPYTNKQLDLAFTTFRDKLQPGEAEKWTITIKNSGGEKEAAEMVAALYDASLDAFVPHSFSELSSFYPTRSFYSHGWGSYNIGASQQSRNIFYSYSQPQYQPSYAYLLMPPFSFYRNDYSNIRIRGAGMMMKSSAQLESVRLAMDDVVVEESVAFADAEMVTVPAPELAKQPYTGAVGAESAIAERGGGGGGTGVPLTEIATRQNFNETAFFYPQLRTNEEGEILIDFVIPEALTRWKMLGFAHTQDVKVGTITNELITQKEVAISANAPRFFRENDQIIFTAKVNNLTDTMLDGRAMLRLYDATNMQPIDEQLLASEQTIAFIVEAEGSVGVKWTLNIPEGVQAIAYKLTAQAGIHTDGEEKTVPVLTNSMLVTETMPFSVRGGQTKEASFDRLRFYKTETLRNFKLTLEYTSNPAWYAVLALPYLMEYPYECAEQTFSRFYANSLASAVSNSSPKIKQIFDQWNAQGSEALMSNLERNQELKQLMLEETPWVMQANNEAERKKRVAVLFDLNRMGNELGRAYNKLAKLQYGNGGIPWFDGMEPSRYITQHIVAGMAHLDKLNALDKRYDVDDMIIRGLSFLDEEVRNDYNELLRRKARLEDMQLSNIQIHYLYACSFSKHKPYSASQLEAFSYYFGQAETYWLNRSIYEQAMLALVMHRYGKADVAKNILASLKEHAQQNEEMGMYWAGNRAGYFWYQAPIETQAMLIEAFNEAGSDTQAVEEMKIWLLRQKQTTDWRTTKATSEAIYALLMTGSNLLDNDKPLAVQLGGKALEQLVVEPIRPEAGTGYVKTSWSGGDIKPEMGELKATNANGSGVAWGAMYWQYFEQLDKITRAETNLRLKEDLMLKKVTDRGEVLEPITSENVLKVGDVVRVRMELRADRDYEYVHLKDMRASGFEPVSTVSGYRYQDGLGYYESVKDASINFFIGYLPKGTYVFEYDLRVSHAGDFSDGITTFQCMYAPEFNAHGEGVRVRVE